MKNKFNKDAFFLATSIIVSFALGAIFAMTLPAISFSDENILNHQVDVDGLFVVFGGNYVVEGKGYLFKFNLGSLIGYLLPFIGLVTAIFAFQKRSKLLYFLSGIICLIGAILIFLEPNFFKAVNEGYINNFASILIGPIMGGIASTIAGIIGIGCGVKINY